MPVGWHFKSVLWFFSAVIPGIGPLDMILILMWTLFPNGQVTGINLSAFSLFWQIPVLSTLSLSPAVHGVPPLGKNSSPVVSPYTLCNKYRHTCTACLLFMLYADNTKSPHLNRLTLPNSAHAWTQWNYSASELWLWRISPISIFTQMLNLFRFRVHVCEYVKPKIFCQY